MALGKILKLGGIENKLPKTDQSLGRFRVARNVLPTPDGRIIPRYDYNEIPGQDSNKRHISYMCQYNDNMLSIANDNVDLDYTLNLYKDTERVPQFLSSGGQSTLGVSRTDFETEEEDISLSFTHFRINNTMYFNNPYTGTCFKYDGVEVSPMGVQQPRIGSSTYNASGTVWVKAICHTLDFDNNEAASEFVKFPTNLVAGNFNIQFGAGITNIIGDSKVEPNFVINPSSYAGQMPYIHSVGMSYNPIDEDYVMGAIVDTNIVSDLQIGTYLFTRQQETATSSLGISAFYSGSTVLAVALKVKSVSPLKLDSKDAKVLKENREWLTVDVKSASAIGNYAVRELITFWTSDSENGPYVLQYMFPYTPLKNVIFSFNISGATPTVPTTISAFQPENLCITLDQTLNKWYDVTSAKIAPNSDYPFTDTLGTGIPSFWGITEFQGSLILYNDEYIWFSDPTAGGSYEQLSGSSFLLVGNREYGKQMSVCGTSDFILVSRQRKNYFVNGVIDARNIRIQEIANIEIGAWSNNATKVIKDSVILITATGIYSIGGGGNSSVISSNIPKMFSRYDNYDVNEDVEFTLIGTDVLSDTSIDQGISVDFDEYRELLFIMRKGINFTKNPVLVLNTKTLEFYEWTNLIVDTNKFASCLAVKDAKVYVASYTPSKDPDPIILGAKIFIEDKDIALSYAPLAPIQLFTTWLTSGEPSLEKQVLQLKMFGRIYKDESNGVKVIHFKDWDFSTAITDVTYLPKNSSQYSHKQRLNSDKVLSVSCGIQIVDPVVSFELESLEIEFNEIQQGMKK